MASSDVARCRHLCAALLLLSAILLVPAESSMKSVEQLVVRIYPSSFLFDLIELTIGIEWMI